MSVLIEGLKLPKDRTITVAIRGDNGIASVYLDEGKADYYRVIELPDHGDLIDRDALPKYTGYALSANDVANAVINANVIIPAERSEDGET